MAEKKVVNINEEATEEVQEQEVEVVTEVEIEEKPGFFKKVGNFVKAHWKTALVVAGAALMGAAGAAVLMSDDSDGDYPELEDSDFNWIEMDDDTSSTTESSETETAEVSTESTAE